MIRSFRRWFCIGHFKPEKKCSDSKVCRLLSVAPLIQCCWCNRFLALFVSFFPVLCSSSCRTENDFAKAYDLLFMWNKFNEFIVINYLDRLVVLQCLRRGILRRLQEQPLQMLSEPIRPSANDGDFLFETTEPAISHLKQVVQTPPLTDFACQWLLI